MPKLRPAIAFAALALTTTLTACQTPGDEARADVYTADQVNSRQAAKVVQILAVLPARVKVDNSANRRTAQLTAGMLGALGGAFLGGGLAHHNVLATGVLGAAGGGALGVAGGSLVSDEVLVAGVSITFVEDGQNFNSTQVGKSCEYVPGRAIVVETSPTTTRIQPNAACPTTART